MIDEAADGRTAPPSPLPEPPSWYPDVLDRLTDLVIVIGPDGTVRYTNPFADQVTGHERGSMIGTNMADHLELEAVERAIEVISAMNVDGLGVPVTPAVYGVRRADDTYLPVEFNAADLNGIDDGSTVLLGRYSGDHDLQDRLLRVLTSGEPISAAIELIPHYGLWRHPDDHYAVHYASPEGRPLVVGDPLSVSMGEELGPDMPWHLAAVKGAPLLLTIEEVQGYSSELADRMRGADLNCCWVYPVDDPLGAVACAIVWGKGDRQPAYHRYALELMHRSLDLALRWRHQVTTLTDAAHRDPLTGLANRAGFFAAVEDLRDSGQRSEVALLYIDLDGFKDVNDRHGHVLGDEVLAEAARRITEVVRPVDTVARLGGDEFAVLCSSLTSVDDAVAVAERILAVVAEPFEVADVVTSVGASIGIAVTGSADVDFDRLVHLADLTLYQAKRNGRNRWELTTAGAVDVP